MSRDGEDKRFVTPGDAASWSPEGDELIVIDNYRDVPLVKLISISNSNETDLDFDAGTEIFPLVDVAWAPAGDLVAVIVKEFRKRVKA